jgi:hypothetical protein
MLQKISISLTTSSASESFRILNVYIRDRRLIVVSKHSYPPGGFGVATCGHFTCEVLVDVEEILPVDHFIIGLSYVTDPEFLPNVEFTKIVSQSDLSVEQREVCLYENPYTEDLEAKKIDSYWKQEKKLFEEYKQNNPNYDLAIAATAATVATDATEVEATEATDTTTTDPKTTVTTADSTYVNIAILVGILSSAIWIVHQVR